MDYLANHLWQSTLFAAAIALLTLAFGANRAQVRYGLWLAAAVKFLVPFAVLAAIGEAVGWPRDVAVVTLPSPVSTAVVEIGAPLLHREALRLATPVAAESIPEAFAWTVLAIWAIGCLIMAAASLFRWARVARLVRRAPEILDGREIDMLRHVEGLSGVQTRLRMVSVESAIEPGVFGIAAPVIIWPGTLSGRLTDAQLQAILLHEVCHVRRRDNLAAALQMVVQVIFWFHPVIWLIGSRLLDERECACDEDVISFGSEAETYAEAILRACRHAVESPFGYVATVGGADLKRRIQTIMNGRASAPLTSSRRLLLAASIAAVILGPVVIGAYGVSAPQVSPPTGPSIIEGLDHLLLRYLRPSLSTFDGNREYQHIRSGTTFIVPEEFLLRGTFPSSDGGDQAVMTSVDPRAEVLVWMTREVIEPANVQIWLDGAPQQKEDQRRGNYAIGDVSDYTIRQGSIHRLSVGGQSAIAAIADYTHEGRAMVEYMTWIYTERSRVFFFTRVAADELEQIRPLVDSMVTSALVP